MKHFDNLSAGLITTAGQFLIGIAVFSMLKTIFHRSRKPYLSEVVLFVLGVMLVSFGLCSMLTAQDGGTLFHNVIGQIRKTLS